MVFTVFCNDMLYFFIIQSNKSRIDKIQRRMFKK